MADQIVNNCSRVVLSMAAVMLSNTSLIADTMVLAPFKGFYVATVGSLANCASFNCLNGDVRGLVCFNECTLAGLKRLEANCHAFIQFSSPLRDQGP